MNRILKHLNHRKYILICLSVLSMLSIAIGFNTLYSSASAEGIPSPNPLFYSGTLSERDGTLLSGKKNISVILWSDAKSVASEKKQCVTDAPDTQLTQGRFRIALNQNCVEAIKKNPNLWVEVAVDQQSLGRSKIGAVPYAVETLGNNLQPHSMECPTGYQREANEPDFVVCKRGADEIVKVGDFWIDRYEVSIVDANAYKNGACDGQGLQFGATQDDYPTGFPDNGNWTNKLYSCSLAKRNPSKFMTWFQAQQACALAGKHLCSNGEWQTAAAGTPDTSQACNIAQKSAVGTGSFANCESNWGAYDMIGNLWEWVDMWMTGGKSWMTGEDGYGEVAPWPEGYNEDKTYNFNGSANSTAGGKMTPGLPSAAFRGGRYDKAISSGIFAISLVNSPAYAAAITGARCCIK